MPATRFQTPDQVVDVSTWERVDGYGVYPEGSREKSLLRCPSPAPFPFLKAGRKYLLKYSRDRYPAQYWCEILAYRLGNQLDLDVPPTHVAIDGKGRSAALIEWFLEEEKGETRFSGGDYLVSLVPDFERKKGLGHSWALVKQLLDYFRTGLNDWKPLWFTMMLFDTLIGNTDRHQENWALIRDPFRGPTPFKSPSISPLGDHFNALGYEGNENWVGGLASDWDSYFGTDSWEHPLFGPIRFGPFFDNGTSLGHELTDARITSITDEELLRYIRKGRAHLRWEGEDTKGMPHFELIDRLLQEEPRYKTFLHDYRQLEPQVIREIVENLVAFQVPEPLSPARGDFMVRLVTLRRHELLARLHDTP